MLDSLFGAHSVAVKCDQGLYRVCQEVCAFLQTLCFENVDLEKLTGERGVHILRIGQGSSADLVRKPLSKDKRHAVQE